MSAASEATPAAAPAERYTIGAERKLAASFMGRIQWEAIAIGLGQCTLWFANGWFVLSGTYSLWVGFPIAVLCCAVAYLPSHEGQHGNISGGQKQWKWLDRVVGEISLIPLAYSHEILRVTHMKHHAHTNDPERDIDINSTGPHWWNAAIGVHRGIPRDMIERYSEEDPAFKAAVGQGILIQKAYHLLTLVLAVFLPLETLLLWWLPRKLGLSYLYIFFSWYPHYPFEQGRYKDTRFWQSRIPRFLCQSMQTHVMHHLYPRIPHWDEPKAMEALRPYLIARGVPGAEDIPEKVRFNQLVRR